MGTVDRFSKETARIIALRVNGLCSFPDCGKTTFFAHSDPEKVKNLGQASHITARSKNGPRYDPELSSEERRSADNGIWLCLEHAREIDVDPAKFSVEDLRRWKHEMEERVAASRRYFLRDGQTHWNVPNRNDFFTGREDLLTQLDAALEASGTAALTQAIIGLGGVGKTQVAVEFCHRHKDLYPCGVFWADASSAANLSASYAELARGLGWAAQEMKIDDAASMWLQRITTTAGWLLVLDMAYSLVEPRRAAPRFPSTASSKRSSATTSTGRAGCPTSSRKRMAL